MDQNISRTKKRCGRGRKRRGKKRIQLFLNFFIFVCILIIMLCIGISGSRDGAVDAGFRAIQRRIAYAADEWRNSGHETAQVQRNAAMLSGVSDSSWDESEYPGRTSDSSWDESEYSDRTTDSIGEEWKLTLVNKWNPLPERVDIEIVELTNGERVDKRIYPYLQKMFDDARAEGIYPVVRSGYRTRQEQEEIYDDRIQGYQADGMSAEEAKMETELWVAVPGTSEHELGLAVDINADKIRSGRTEVYAWLKDHAHLYGFINRYPSDKTEITGVANEPWHYRYVGTGAAAEIYERGICLEEYLGSADTNG